MGIPANLEPMLRMISSFSLLRALYAVKGALLTDCYTRPAEMDGKTQAASRHIADSQGAQGKVNRVGRPRGADVT
jgi:hypothetical protein